jgi:periplasmic mercuric ion binding protein
MKNSYTNLILLILTITVLATAASFVKIRATADTVAILQANGITCGSCASAIEKALQKNKGVASVKVDVNGGRVAVGYDSGSIGAELIASTVAELGYSNKIEMLMSVEQYQRLAGKASGMAVRRSGCGGGCCN